MLHFGGIADQELDAVAGETHPAGRFRRRHGQVHQALEGGVLLLHSFAVRFIDGFDGSHQAGFGKLHIGIRREREGHGVPDIVGARHLTEQGAGLEENRVRESHDAAGRLEVGVAAGYLHEVEAHQPDFEDIAGHAGDCDAVADAQSVAADQEKVSDDRYDHVLKRDRQARGQESGVSGQRAELVDQPYDDRRGNDAGDHHAPHEEKLFAAPRVAHVAEGATAPEFRNAENHQDCEDEPDGTEQQIAGSRAVTLPRGLALVHQAAARDIDLESMLAQWNHSGRHLFETCAQGFNLLTVGVHLLHGLGGGIVHGGVAAADGGREIGDNRGAEVIETLA